jgi:glucose-6-phosphate isomerase
VAQIFSAILFAARIAIPAPFLFTNLLSFLYMPRAPYIEYDYRFMLRENIHEAGITKKGFDSMCRDLEDVQVAFNKRGAWNPKMLLSGADKDALKTITTAAKSAQAKAKTLVVVGIGGSDLGARALIQALDARNVLFVGATTDPVALERDLEKVNLHDTVFNIVSKSGETLETLTTFAIIDDRLKTELGEKRAQERLVITTGAKGRLRDIAIAKDYPILDIPEEIGGRYSVFTACGLFPAAFAGLKIEKIIAGAETTISEVMRSVPDRSAALVFAGLHARAYMDERVENTVLMSYGGAFEMLGVWFRQLWAESLGKALNRKNGGVNIGFMPIAANGPVDQHSQLQLYLDGPLNTAVTFIATQKIERDIRIPKTTDIVPELRNKKISELLDIEMRATSLALAESGRLNGTLRVGKIDEEHIGALLTFFMCATVTIGELFDINVFDQPAVERIKRHVAKMLVKK